MTQKTDQTYVLGTHDEEIERLGLQHRVWRPTVLQCWSNAGITKGSKVIDIGAGPGYASVDLAEIVGASGEVLAVERSERFISAARNACEIRGLTNVRFQAADLMDDKICDSGFDASWCRWVASFVSDPAKLIEKISECLKPGGMAIFHEYLDYGTWRFAPRRLAIESFVKEVMESWRASGGEPDIALAIPTLLKEAGLEIISVKPHVFTVTPGNFIWQWPVGFIEVNLARLLELGRVTEEWVERVRAEVRMAEADPTTLMTTPIVLEIIARKAR